MIHTANHFYTSPEGDWICRNALSNIGFVTKDEYGLPVGDKQVSDQIKESMWVCPHIYGGLPTTVDEILVKIHGMVWDAEGIFEHAQMIYRC